MSNLEILKHLERARDNINAVALRICLKGLLDPNIPERKEQVEEAIDALVRVQGQMRHLMKPRTKRRHI